MGRYGCRGVGATRFGCFSGPYRNEQRRHIGYASDALWKLSDYPCALPDRMFTLSKINATYGLFTRPRLPKYKFGEREVGRSASNQTSARNRNAQGPTAPPESDNSVERRSHRRWMGRQNGDDFCRARGGGRAVGFEAYTIKILSFASSLLSRRR